MISARGGRRGATSIASSASTMTSCRRSAIPARASPLNSPRQCGGRWRHSVRVAIPARRRCTARLATASSRSWSSVTVSERRLSPPAARAGSHLRRTSTTRRSATAPVTYATFTSIARNSRGTRHGSTTRGSRTAGVWGRAHPRPRKGEREKREGRRTAGLGSGTHRCARGRALQEQRSLAAVASERCGPRKLRVGFPMATELAQEVTADGR